MQNAHEGGVGRSQVAPPLPGVGQPAAQPPKSACEPHPSMYVPSQPETQVMFLQDMPTKEWGEEEVEPLLSQAYILSTLFEGSPNHLGAAS